MGFFTTTLLIAGGAYLLLALFFFFFQHLFFFRPEILPSGFSYNYPFDFEEHTFQMEDGGIINSIFFKVPNSRGVIYYLKGNSRSIKGWGKFAKDFLGNGYDFFMLDYRGFGKSTGKRKEHILYNDAQHLYKWLSEQYDESQIVVYGRSLGSGIAARVASWNRPAMLILDSPYYSFKYNINRYLFFLPLRWLLRYQIRTDQFLKSIKTEVHILHGDKDWLIPFSQSKKLVQINPDQILLHVIPGAGHNNLPDFADYHEKLYELMDIAVSVTESVYELDQNL
ncbi:MAG: alpha/beta fold hydrolase [Bacteroidota bacterium]